MKCLLCWGSGVQRVRGPAIPREELSDTQRADELANGGRHYRYTELPCPLCAGGGHWPVNPRRNRMKDKNQTFSAMAAVVESELQRVRDAVERVNTSSIALRNANAQLDNANQRLASARDALFEAHPELVPPVTQTGSTDDWQPPGPGAFTPIEVDDPDEGMPDFSETRT